MANNFTDAKKAAMLSLTGASVGSLQDLEKAFLVSLTGLDSSYSLEDLWKAYYISQGVASVGSVADMKRAFLDTAGYATNDIWKDEMDFWLAGGSFGGFSGTFYASFDVDQTADSSVGSPTGTLHGTANVTGGVLDVNTVSGNPYCDWSAVGNADMAQQGCIRMGIIPQYTGWPTASKSTFVITTRADGNGLNQVSFWHTSTLGQIEVYIRSTTGADIVNVALGEWNAVAGQEYEFELNWDITTGVTELYIDGALFGASQNGTGTRDGNNTLLRIGSGASVGATPYFHVNYIKIWDTPQHTANYATPLMAADYEVDGDLTIYGGSPTVTLHGGASVSGGLLDLTGGLAEYAEYQMDGNWNPTTQGCIRLLYKPNYSGTPSGSQVIFHRGKVSNSQNMLRLDHEATTGTFKLWIRQNNGTFINSTAFAGAWSPTAGQVYEIEVDFDLTAGETRLFVDGVQWDVTLTGTGTLTNVAGNILYLGTDSNATTRPDFSILDMKVFSAPQHMTDYTP